MESQKLHVFLSLFQPFAFASAVSGFLAFILLVAGTDTITVALTVVWFNFMCSAALCLMLRGAVKKLGFSGLLWGFTAMLGALGASLTLVALLSV